MSSLSFAPQFLQQQTSNKLPHYRTPPKSVPPSICQIQGPLQLPIRYTVPIHPEASGHSLKDLKKLNTWKMVVRLRLARWGRKDLPFYRIVAADARAPRDGKHLEILGTFNPIAASDGVKEMRVNSQRVRYWMSVGAQPSDRVAHLLGLANVLPLPPTRQFTKKNVAKKDREAK